MQIKLENLGRRYNKDWIFNNLTHIFEPTSKTAVLGRNGSGKSTLIQLIYNILSPSVGSITYTLENKNINQENIFKYISVATPYQELVEEFTLKETFHFHFKFKSISGNHSISELIELIEIPNNNKPIKYFSSGMKQRVKLATAIFSDTPLLLLDEPLSNLDNISKEWYKKMIEIYTKNKTIIVCSNHQQDEYFYCNQQINIEDYKK
jgi:ABC-type multidrug transport system ATPase subunit